MAKKRREIPWFADPSSYGPLRGRSHTRNSSPIEPGPGPVPTPKTRGKEKKLYTETPFSPTTVLYTRTGEYTTGWVADSQSMYSIGHFQHWLMQTWQGWVFVRSDWIANTGDQVFWEPNGTSGYLALYYNSGTAPNNGGRWTIRRNIGEGFRVWQPIYLIPRNEWHHVTIVFEEEKALLYIDGVLEDYDESYTWYRTYTEGNTFSTNQQESWIVTQSSAYLPRCPFNYMGAVRTFSHAMNATEVAATWNKILWPGYEGMLCQMIGLDDDDVSESGYIDNTCWGSHIKWAILGTGGVAAQATPPVAFPSIIRQQWTNPGQVEEQLDIIIDDWPTGTVTEFPNKTFKLHSPENTALNMGTVTDPGGGDDKYWTINHNSGETIKQFRFDVDPSAVKAWNKERVDKGGYSVIVLMKDFYYNDLRFYGLIGSPRLGRSDGWYCYRVYDQCGLIGLGSGGALDDVLQSATPGTTVTRNWYFHEYQLIPTETVTDEQWIGTFRARWWPEGDGIDSPPGSWNLSYDCTASSRYSRVPQGGVSKTFRSHLHYAEGEVPEILSPFRFNLQGFRTQTAFIKRFRFTTFAGS